MNKRLPNPKTHDKARLATKNHEIICARGFPSHSQKKTICKNNAIKSADNTHTKESGSNVLVLGIGANIGDNAKILARFWHLLCFFALHSRIFSIATSPIYRNPPFGYLNQAHFYNAIIVLSTSLSLLQVYALVFYLERRFGRGRKREFKNAPRMLDIDIIFYNDLLVKRGYLDLPHKNYHKRLSVLVPMLLCGYMFGGFYGGTNRLQGASKQGTSKMDYYKMYCKG